MTQDQLKQICGKYGTVTSCKLQTGFNGVGQQVSLGKATVSYSSADEASVALKKLHFESELGDLLSIDFYKTRELRMEQDAQNSEFAK